MTVDSYRRAVEQHQRELARLQADKARDAAKAADDTRRSNEATAAASRTTSVPIAKSKLSDAQRYQESAVRCQKAVATLEAKIATEQKRLNDALRQLANAEAQEQRRRSQQQARAEREHQDRMSGISKKLSTHDELHRATHTVLTDMLSRPDSIRVLFFAANPLDQQQLRLDEEVREITEIIRKSEHRDVVSLESRWAVRPLDVLQAINELRPTIVHFSGHGSEDDVIFQDSAGKAKPVSKEALVQTMAASSSEILLVFFNTCYSRGQAEAMVQHVSAAIGMSTAIGDTAARIFSAQFYSSIGFGLSVGLAFRQARAALMLEGIPEESTPELFTRAGVTADELILVKPPSLDANAAEEIARQQLHSPVQEQIGSASPRPRIRMSRLVGASAVLTKPDDFIRGLDIPFARLQNTGEEEAFHVKVRIEGVRSLEITSASVDHLAAGEQLIVRHRDLHLRSDGKDLAPVNLWMQLMAMNGFQGGEPIQLPLAAVISYNGGTGETFETRYELSNAAFTFKGDTVWDGVGTKYIASGQSEQSEVAALRRELDARAPRRLTEDQAAIIIKHLRPLVEKEKLRSATGASVNIHVDPGGGCGDCGPYALQYEKLFRELGFRIMNTSLSQYRDDVTGEYDDYRYGITIRRDTQRSDRVGAQKFGDAFAAALGECGIKARILEREGTFFDVIIGYKDDE